MYPKIQDMARISTTPVERQTCEGVNVPDDTTTGRHFGIEDESSAGFFELSINGR